LVQLDWPAIENLPSGHATHVLADVAPTALEYVPAGQLVQVVAVPLRYVPAAQVTVALSGGAPASLSAGDSFDAPQATRPTNAKSSDNELKRTMEWPSRRTATDDRIPPRPRTPRDFQGLRARLGARASPVPLVAWSRLRGSRRDVRCLARGRTSCGASSASVRSAGAGTRRDI
jgi:hypothetical protein